MTAWATPRPAAISSYGEGNTLVRTQHWRYIRYEDGSEELYDHRNDPGEHRNLAANPDYADVLTEHRKWLPATDAYPAGKDDVPEDRYDKKVQQFKTEGVPAWLK